jgi:hypothetical protein
MSVADSFDGRSVEWIEGSEVEKSCYSSTRKGKISRIIHGYVWGTGTISKVVRSAIMKNMPHNKPARQNNTS